MRLPVQKTFKLYVGGEFVRSESGQTMTIPSPEGNEMIYVSRAGRADFRNAMEIARQTQTSWATRTAYNRGQILYRLAEMLESRGRGEGIDRADQEAAIDRAVYYAGWSDKITAVLSNLNPVATGPTSYSMPRPLGIILAISSPKNGLLGLIEALCAGVVMGNAVILLAAAELVLQATLLAESLATCDMPQGVVQILTSDTSSLLREANRHDELSGIYLAPEVIEHELMLDTQTHAARVMRRIFLARPPQLPATPLELASLAEMKTVWLSR